MYAKPLKFGLYCKLTVHLDLDSQELHSPMLLLCCWMGTVQGQSPHCCHTPWLSRPKTPFQILLLLYRKSLSYPHASETSPLSMTPAFSFRQSSRAEHLILVQGGT